MAKIFDILLDDDCDLLIKDNDLVVGESTQQHIKLLMATSKGEWKADPLAGVGLENFINDDDQVTMIREIEYQLEHDKANARVTVNSNGNLNVVASYGE